MFGTILGWELFVLVSAIIGLVYAGVQSYLLLKIKVDDPRVQEISGYIHRGSSAFMRRQYTTVFIFVIVLTFVIFGSFYAAKYSNAAAIAGGFFVGALGSAVAGLIGMNISVRANARAAIRARLGLNPALSVAMRGGSVTGLTVISLALLGLVTFEMIYNNPSIMIGFIFGASIVSLFARVGGGIYTKGADVGADLVGKIEQGLPEDDERNPAVIADNVGDNVGDCAGMGADLYETFVVTALASMYLAYLLKLNPSEIILPLVLGAVAILSTIAGIFFVRGAKKERIMGALYRGLIATVVLSIIGFYIAIDLLVGSATVIFVDAVIGIVIMLVFVYVTEYYTSERFSPVARIAKASSTGSGTNIITGLAYGLQAIFVPAVVIIVGILVSFGITAEYGIGSGFSGSTYGLYGVAVAAAAMLSATGIIISIDSFGPITDNAGGIAEMAGFDETTRNNVTDPLDAVGNTTKAVTKGYAIGSAVLAALTLFAAFKVDIQAVFPQVEIDNPLVLVGLIIGAMLPFFFTSYLMNSVGKAAYAIVEEVRKQFREHPGILERTEKPDYGRAVDIVTREALHQLLIPALIGIATPILIGFILGPLALGGVLIGVILSGFPLAIMMTVGGGAWDNAKKYVEQGNYGGKGSEAHKAAVVGDTVGDATKDTAGPAINPLVKVVNTVSVLFIALMLNHYLLMGIVTLF